jgi:Protein of unknown function (DUF1071).
MATEKNYFQVLYDIDVSEKAKEKNGLTYLPWSAVWAEVKKNYPNSYYTVYENEDGRPWFDDGKTAWVKTGVTINGLEHIEYLPVMNLRNKSMPADEITSMDANKAIQRSITKACGRHGVGLFVYEGEDVPESVSKLQDLNDVNFKLAQKISEMGENKSNLVGEIIAKYESSRNPKKVKDIETAEALYEELAALRRAK